MSFSPSIQSLVGTHSGGVSIGLNWTANKAFELSGTNLSRYGLITGTEEAFVALANLGGVGTNGVSAYIGLAANGNIFISASNTLYSGAAIYANGTTLASINVIPYDSPNFGQGGMLGITKTGAQYCVDRGLGNSVIGVLNRIIEISTTTFLTNQDYALIGGKCCAGLADSGIAYVISADDPSCEAVLTKIEFDGIGGVTSTDIGSPITMADIDAGWTSQFQVQGMCLDQTDAKILAVFSGAGNSNKAYLAKINPTTAVVEWATLIPATNGGGPVTVGQTFQYSDIRYQRLGIYTGSPATVTIYNTSTGAVDDTYTTGLGGLFPRAGGQCYSDTLGAIVLSTDFADGVGAPTRLNSTPSSWSDGYGVLYVAEPISPPVPTIAGYTRIWGNWNCTVLTGG